MLSSVKVISTIKNATYGSFKVSSLLWGFWVGTYGYSKFIHFLQYKTITTRPHKIYDISFKHLFVSGIIGSYITWNIF